MVYRQATDINSICLHIDKLLTIDNDMTIKPWDSSGHYDAVRPGLARQCSWQMRWTCYCVGCYTLSHSIT